MYLLYSKSVGVCIAVCHRLYCDCTCKCTKREREREGGERDAEKDEEVG